MYKRKGVQLPGPGVVVVLVEFGEDVVVDVDIVDEDCVEVGEDAVVDVDIVEEDCVEVSEDKVDDVDEDMVVECVVEVVDEDMVKD